MEQVSDVAKVTPEMLGNGASLEFELPDPDDDQIPEFEFQQQIDQA